MTQQPLFQPPITLSELESFLWEAANILRGSPVDRTDWKSYILPLLFFKRICDVWDEEYQEAVETYGEDFSEEHRFQVPEDCHWTVVRETPANVGTALQNAMRGIEAANQKHLYGVFGDVQWGNKERLPDALLKELIELAHEMREADRRGEELGLTEDKIAFYDALEVNDSAVQVLGNETLGAIAQELVRAVRNNVTIDWTLRENVRAKIRVMVKRTLRRYGYPPDKQETATLTVLEQAEVPCRDWAVV
jgi:type I restriction-modification system DNA methylase subunit